MSQTPGKLHCHRQVGIAKKLLRDRSIAHHKNYFHVATHGELHSRRLTNYGGIAVRLEREGL